MRLYTKYIYLIYIKFLCFVLLQIDGEKAAKGKEEVGPFKYI